MQMIQPPRAVPPALLKDVKQVEFVGYVANPMYKRGAGLGEATKAVAPLRIMRIKPKQDVLHAMAAARARQVQQQQHIRHHVHMALPWLIPSSSMLAITRRTTIKICRRAGCSGDCQAEIGRGICSDAAADGVPISSLHQCLLTWQCYYRATQSSATLIARLWHLNTVSSCLSAVQLVVLL